MSTETAGTLHSTAHPRTIGTMDIRFSIRSGVVLRSCSTDIGIGVAATVQEERRVL